MREICASIGCNLTLLWILMFAFSGMQTCTGSKIVNGGIHSLCAQMGPSQPSLQMQVNVSPPPTHVPPFRQGLDAQVLFFAEVER